MINSSYEEYLKEKSSFITRHCGSGIDGKSNQNETSRDTIDRTIAFKDGAFWHETSEKIWEEASVYVHGIKIPVSVQMWRTEFWSSEDNRSKFWFQPA